MKSESKTKVVLACVVFFLTVSVRCQERITIFSSSGENEIDYEKPTEKSQNLVEKHEKHSPKPISVKLTMSTNPSEDRIIASTITSKDQTTNKFIMETKTNDKRSSVVNMVTNDTTNYDEKHPQNERIPESRKLDFSNKNQELNNVVEKSNKSPGIVCPEKDLPRPLFAPSCATSKDCLDYGNDMLCCEKQCLRGVKPPRIQTQHDPIFFGMIHRKCPSDPLPELSEVKKCKTDSDCFPRICCTEALQKGDTANYCRTPEPLWDNLPIPNQVLDPLKTLVAYMQCTPPPPPIFDLFPKPCQNPLDCFPNLCCQERGKRYCRPPKRSILALVADIGTRLIPENAAKQFIERISR